MKIFATALLAYRDNAGSVSIESIVAVLIASSQEEAKGKGFKYLDGKFPSSDGWRKEVATMEVTTDLIDELIKSQE